MGDDWSESPTMDTRGKGSPYAQPPQPDVSLPISNERNAFVEDSNPFDEPEAKLEMTMEVPAPTAQPIPPTTSQPPAGFKKTRMMPGGRGGGGNFGLVLMGLQGKKRDRAAEVLARLQGCSREDALAQLTGIMVTVLQGVSKTEAESALALFTKAEVPAKVTGK
jgi:hypothetical protein